MDNEKDKFIEIVKEKLTNYTLPVDDDSWDKIAERLNPTPGKMKRVWLAAVAVAASILLLFLLFPVDKKTPRRETANRLPAQEEKIIPNTPPKEIVQTSSPQKLEQPKVSGKYQPGKQLSENNVATEVIPKEETGKENLPVPVAKNGESKKEEPKVAENHSVSPVSDFNFEDDEQAPAIKHKKQKSIRFSFGSGGNLLAANTVNAPLYAPGASGFYLNSDLMSFQNAGKSKDISSYKKNYRLPLSFGVTMKKELNRTFALESGIVYTFLSTSFTGGTFPRSNAELQLHYLGIPLNLHTRILGNRVSPWQIYLSGGGMVEKGILSHFVQKTYYDESAGSTITSNERIKGLQWSVNISPGADYRIYKNYGIYLEPKLSYYFNDNQPISARTNHPVVVGINAGIRYAW